MKRRLQTPADIEREFGRALEAYARDARFSLSEAFSEQLLLWTIAAAPRRPDASHPHGSTSLYETEYMDLAQKHDPDVVREHWPKVYALLAMSYQRGADVASGSWCDPLGVWLETLGHQSDRKWFGQFFTPPAVCDLLAGMTIPKPETLPDNPRILDPACGSGRLLLASAAQLERHLAGSGTYVGVDLDKRCVQMTALNLFGHGLRGVVLHGNALTLEHFGGFLVTRFGMSRLSEAEREVWMRPMAASRAEDQRGQLALF